MTTRLGNFFIRFIDRHVTIAMTFYLFIYIIYLWYVGNYGNYAPSIVKRKHEFTRKIYIRTFHNRNFELRGISFFCWDEGKIFSHRTESLEFHHKLFSIDYRIHNKFVKSYFHIYFYHIFNHQSIPIYFIVKYCHRNMMV